MAVKTNSTSCLRRMASITKICQLSNTDNYQSTYKIKRENDVILKGIQYTKNTFYHHKGI